MIIKIDLASEIAIYIQLKNQIIEGIATGQLRPDEQLPSVRQLASDIGINMHTVNKVYGQLKSEGYTLIHKRKGVIINKLEDMKDPSYSEELEIKIKPLIAESICKGLTESDYLNLCKGIFKQLKKGEINKSELNPNR
jgi:GntR family transcriptional regulator